MVRLVLKDGVFVPTEPLPADWHDGHEVEIPPTDATCEEPIDAAAWLHEWEALPGLDADDWQRVQTALTEQRQQGKEHMRRLMGLD